MTTTTTDLPQGVGQKGRFYLTKNIWVPQEPLENLNLRLSDWILRNMPKLPLAGEDALKSFRPGRTQEEPRQDQGRPRLPAQPS